MCIVHRLSVQPTVLIPRNVLPVREVPERSQPSRVHVNVFIIFAAPSLVVTNYTQSKSELLTLNILVKTLLTS